MFVSYVVRLRADALERGSVSGEVEGVATGQRFNVGSLEQLAAFIAETRRHECGAVRRAAELGAADPWPVA